MITKIIEATNELNWGRFMVAKFSDEFGHQSQVSPITPDLVRNCGWSEHHTWVCDLVTGEGACFRAAPDAYVEADLKKHRIWICPLFAPFLKWLYKQDLSDLSKLPDLVRMTWEDSIQPALSGRMPGPNVCASCGGEIKSDTSRE